MAMFRMSLRTVSPDWRDASMGIVGLCESLMGTSILAQSSTKGTEGHFGARPGMTEAVEPSRGPPAGADLRQIPMQGDLGRKFARRRVSYGRIPARYRPSALPNGPILAVSRAPG